MKTGERHCRECGELCVTWGNCECGLEPAPDLSLGGDDDRMFERECPNPECGYVDMKEPEGNCAWCPHCKSILTVCRVPWQGEA